MTELEARDRNLCALLADAGLRPEGAAGLAFRLHVADGMTPEQVAATLGLAVSTVVSRISRVRQKLLAAEDAHQRGAAPDPDPDDDGDPVVEEARNLLEALRNTAATGPENPATCGPLISLGDAIGVIREAQNQRIDVTIR